MICRTCGAQIAAEARFCGTCGAEVAEPAGPTIEDEERKVITVLFADLAGFTAASETADPEDVAARLSHFHQIAYQTVSRFGGRVEKLLGDGVFAVFGAPAAHEDDPLRGVRAALRIQDELHHLNRRDESLALDVRAAVTTGEAMVVLSGSTTAREGIVGDVVNTASRLQQVAPIGGVVVDERTQSATERQIDYEGPDSALVKGKSEPIPIWLARSLRSRMGMYLESYESLFVGRKDELSYLEKAFEHVTHAENSRVVSIIGEPGAGKSRLLHEFSNVVDRLPYFVSWRQGRCLPYGEGTTYWPLAGIVKAQAGILESDSADAAHKKLVESIAGLTNEAAVREWLGMRLSPLVGITPVTPASPTSREELFGAWAQFILLIAAQAPLVLVVEDLHWADPAMVDFLRYLLDQPGRSPLLLLVTGRPETADIYPYFGTATSHLERILLGSLSEDEISRIVKSLLQEAELSEGIRAAVLERSEGNPLYAGEFALMLRQRGLLVHEKGKVSLRGEVPMPESLQALIASRIDALTPEEKLSLQAASVIGKVFWAECVAAMVSGRADDNPMVIEGLIHKEMIMPLRESSMAVQREYTFRHALVREVGYSQIPRPRRVALHVAAAEWIAGGAAERLRDFAETLAHHYTNALDLAEKARLPGVEDLKVSARRYLRLAGDRSMDLDAGQALTYYQRALELTAPFDPEHTDLLALVGRAEFATGKIDEGIRRLNDASEAFRSAGNDLAEAEVLSRLRSAVWMKGDASRVDEINRRALELVEGRPPSPEAATVLAGALSTMWLRGDTEGALGLADQALEVALESGSPEDLASVYTSMGAAKNHAGLPGGLADMERALEIALEHGLIRSAVSIYNNLGDNTLYMSGTEAALPYLDEGIRLARERGLTAAGYYIRMTRLDLLCYGGRWDALIADADQLSAEVGTDTQVSVGSQAWTLPARAYRGGASAALDKADRAIAKARQVEDAQWAKVLLMGAIVLEHGGRSDEVVQIVEEFARSTQGRDSFRAEMLPMATRLLMRHGETELAADMSTDIRPVNRYGELSLMTSQAAVAEAIGDSSRAHDLYSKAALGWSEWGSPLEEGYSRAGEARTRGEGVKAQQAHEAARALLTGLGAEVALREIDVLIASR